MRSTWLAIGVLVLSGVPVAAQGGLPTTTGLTARPRVLWAADRERVVQAAAPPPAAIEEGPPLLPPSAVEGPPPVGKLPPAPIHLPVQPTMPPLSVYVTPMNHPAAGVPTPFVDVTAPPPPDHDHHHGPIGAPHEPGVGNHVPHGVINGTPIPANNVAVPANGPLNQTSATRVMAAPGPQIDVTTQEHRKGHSGSVRPSVLGRLSAWMSARPSEAPRAAQQAPVLMLYPVAMPTAVEAPTQP